MPTNTFWLFNVFWGQVQRIGQRQKKKKAVSFEKKKKKISSNTATSYHKISDFRLYFVFVHLLFFCGECIGLGRRWYRSLRDPLLDKFLRYPLLHSLFERKRNVRVFEGTHPQVGGMSRQLLSRFLAKLPCAHPSPLFLCYLRNKISTTFCHNRRTIIANSSQFQIVYLPLFIF